MQVNSIAQCSPSAILSTIIKLPIVIKIFVLSIFEPSYTGLPVHVDLDARKPDFVASTQSDQHFIFRFLKSIIAKLAMCKVSVFKLVSVAEQADSNCATKEINLIFEIFIES